MGVQTVDDRSANGGPGGVLLTRTSHKENPENQMHVGLGECTA